MAKKKPPEEGAKRKNNPNVMGLRPEVLEQPITETLEINYMPYAMSVIVSRAIPEIDGFKPSHRKLLYTMYKMGLLTGGRTKSANIVGTTMKLNPHGDAAIYDTMVRLSRGYGALLHPLVDSKGNFGKVYSRDMAWAASRYTEAKLDAICTEIFRDIDQDTVDFVDNYDSSMQEPALLPTTFPNVLVASNMGIAVGMASNICGFNLSEVCDATIAYMKDPQVSLLDVLKAPDFPTGGELLYDAGQLADVYRTGRGSFQVRAKWRYLKEENLIEVYEIPYRSTPLMDSFSCNFNILVAGMPRVMGVGEILEEWTAWRMDSVRRRVYFVMKKKQEKLHLLKGLKKILLDIDRAIKIIRETEEDVEVVPNLMIGFGIDEIQADYVADIKLRNINKEYILKRIEETSTLEEEIADLQDTVNKPQRIKKIIADELEHVKKKYAVPRRTDIIYEHVLASEPDAVEEVADYAATAFLSREGYFKKITAASLRMASDQKYKEGDGPWLQWEANNRDELLVFTDRQQCYKTRLSDFDDAKASVLGDYLPTKLDMEQGESVVWVCIPGDYTAHVLFVFENGKAARVELSAYQTQTRRKRLTGAYSDKSPLAAAVLLAEDLELAVTSTEGRCVVFHTASLAPKSTRSTQGVNIMTLKPRYKVERVEPLEQTKIVNAARYRARSLPIAGALLKEEDRGQEQLTLL